MKNPSDLVYFYDGGVKYTPLTNAKSDSYLYAERKGNGVVRDIFGKKIIIDLYGEAGLGGVSNSSIFRSSSLPYRYKMVVLSKDGLIRNFKEIQGFLAQKNIPFKADSSEVEVFTKLFHYHFQHTGSGMEAMKRCANGNGVPKIEGQYAVIALTPNSIVAASKGKPLGYFKRGDGAYFSSESAGPWSLSPEMTASNFSEIWKDILPGEIVEIFRDGTIKKDTFETSKKICSFEWAYFARPDSVIDGKEVGVIQMGIGKLLAPKVIENLKKNGSDLDNCFVAPVLASGEWYGIGLAEETNWNFIPALYKNKYSMKSFILDVQNDRDHEVMIKHIPSAHLLKGKEVILADDSIVRGTTMRRIIDNVRAKGEPKKIHVVIGYPEKKFACPYGTESDDSLVARDHSVEEIAKSIHADTLTYGTHEMWMQVLGDKYCTRCEKKEK